MIFLVVIDWCIANSVPVCPICDESTHFKLYISLICLQVSRYCTTLRFYTFYGAIIRWKNEAVICCVFCSKSFCSCRQKTKIGVKSFPLPFFHISNGTLFLYYKSIGLLAAFMSCKSTPLVLMFHYSKRTTQVILTNTRFEFKQNAQKLVPLCPYLHLSELFALVIR